MGLAFEEAGGMYVDHWGCPDFFLVILRSKFSPPSHCDGERRYTNYYSYVGHTSYGGSGLDSVATLEVKQTRHGSHIWVGSDTSSRLSIPHSDCRGSRQHS